ncbi:MAG: hypothetical protein RIR18_851 [Pseudomonadota bacterium]|jgi:copper(I)-binding protein
MKIQQWLMVVGWLFSVSVLAADADQILVQEPYVRLPPPNAPVAGAFMVLKNQGNKDIKILKAESSVSRLTELHTHLHEDGMMKMRQVPYVEVKAKGQAVLAPGGLHIMLIDLKTPLKEGDVVPLSFTLDDGSRKQINAKVLRP